jgi:hypothetical protein
MKGERKKEQEKKKKKKKKKRYALVSPDLSFSPGYATASRIIAKPAALLGGRPRDIRFSLFPSVISL